MTTFIILAVAMTGMVIGWLVLPLLRGIAPSPVSSVQLNTSIYRDHLSGLERDFAIGQLDAAELEAARNELQLRLLDDTSNEVGATPAFQKPAKSIAIVLALLLPLGAAAGYWWLGNPSAIDPQAAQAAGRAQIQKMVDNLAAKQAANPDNLQGWAMLGRSYKVLGRMDDAAKAYAKAGAFLDSNADLLVEYADVLALSQDSNLQGKPTDLLAQALKLDPKHPMGLLMMGVSAYQREDYKMAIAQWDRLLQDLEPGSEDAQQVEGNIAQAKQKMSQKSPGKSPQKP